MTGTGSAGGTWVDVSPGESWEEKYNQAAEAMPAKINRPMAMIQFLAESLNFKTLLLHSSHSIHFTNASASWRTREPSYSGRS